MPLLAVTTCTVLSCGGFVQTQGSQGILIETNNLTGPLQNHTLDDDGERAIQ